MTAPARTATPARSRTAAPRRTERVRSPAVQRAYARRAQRTGALPDAQDSVEAAGRAPFVVLMMTLLVMALVATLWLSTAAAADSYQLQSARERARNLTEHSEDLGREVANLETAPELARRARGLGMVPAGDPARLVVHPDGTVTRLGEPRRAIAPAPAQPASPAPAPSAAPGQPAPGQPAPASTAAPAPVPAAVAGQPVSGAH